MKINGKEDWKAAGGPKWVGGGISFARVIDGKIPKPTLVFKWGEDLSEESLQRLFDGETGTLMNEKGEPHAWVLMDYLGTIREGPLNWASREEQLAAKMYEAYRQALGCRKSTGAPIDTWQELQGLDWAKDRIAGWIAAAGVAIRELREWEK